MTTTTKRSPGWWLQEMPEEERREFARKGGLNARNNPNTHRFTSDEAKAAGQKGGKVSKRTKREIA